MPTMPQNFGSINDIRHFHRGHFFDESTMRFFQSRILEGVYHGCYFITSEKPPHGPRAYTIRMIDGDGQIQTIGEHGQYATPEAARRALEHTTEEAIEHLSLFEDAEKCKEIARYHKGDEYTTTPEEQIIEGAAGDIAAFVLSPYAAELYYEQNRAWVKLLKKHGHIIDWQEVAKHFLALV